MIKKKFTLNWIFYFYWDETRMTKTKTSPKQKKSLENIRNVKLKKNANITPYEPLQRLTDENFIGKAIVECLNNNDPEGVMEVISIYLDALKKVQFAEQADISRSTLYHSLRKKNPTIKTLAKLMHASTLEVKK